MLIETKCYKPKNSVGLHSWHACPWFFIAGIWIYGGQGSKPRHSTWEPLSLPPHRTHTASFSTGTLISRE